MVKISYHVSHEQFSPRELLDLVRHAEDVGFDAAFSSDHIQPWLPDQGHSGYLWAWLGAAMQATHRLTFAAITVPGGWRHHPTVAAQAIATIGQMFPGRMPWIALGSGEALNECVVGQGWPEKAERNARLKEGADVIRHLLRGETVSQSGHFSTLEARIWSRPQSAPRLIGAALSEATAAFVAEWADGLLTTARHVDDLRRICAAFRASAPNKPMHAKIDLCWAPTDLDAMRQAHTQWRAHCLPKDELATLRTPEQFEHAARAIAPENVHQAVLISSDLGQHIEWLRERMALGFESIDLHQVGRDQHEFIEAFGSRVLPALREG